MDLQELINDSNKQTHNLMDARDKISEGKRTYFEVDTIGGYLDSSEALVDVFDGLIAERVKKHQELVETIQKLERIKSELDMLDC